MGEEGEGRLTLHTECQVIIAVVGVARKTKERGRAPGACVVGSGAHSRLRM